MMNNKQTDALRVRVSVSSYRWVGACRARGRDNKEENENAETKVKGKIAFIFLGKRPVCVVLSFSFGGVLPLAFLSCLRDLCCHEHQKLVAFRPKTIKCVKICTAVFQMRKGE